MSLVGGQLVQVLLSFLISSLHVFRLLKDVSLSPNHSYFDYLSAVPPRYVRAHRSTQSSHVGLLLPFVCFREN